MEKSPLQNFTYGLFFVTAKYRKKDSGCVTNTAIQVTSQPEQISIALNNASFTNEMIKQSEMFNVSVINQNVDFELIKRFGFQTGRNIEKFENLEQDLYKNKVSSTTLTKIGDLVLEKRINES